MDKITVEIFPALGDHANYIYILHAHETNEVAIIDPGEATPLLSYLADRGLTPNYILNTHHHWDHTDGNMEIKENTGCKIVGFSGDAHRIPGIDIKLNDGDTFNFGNEQIEIHHLPGHTAGAITFYFPKSKMLFPGDTIFAMGCGRLLEGTPEQMFSSLNMIKKFPEDTLVYCGHEYTMTNASFSLTIDPDNQDLKNRYDAVKPETCTMPTTILLEKQTNPFLRAKTIEEFTEIRSKRNKY